MVNAKLPLLVALLLSALLLAGCGTPDEQEGDENAASEQESVGEGEVPSAGVVGTLVAAVAAVAGVSLLRRK